MLAINTDTLHRSGRSKYLAGQYILNGSEETLESNTLSIKGRVSNIKNDYLDGKPAIFGTYKGKKVKRINTIHDGKSRGVWAYV